MSESLLPPSAVHISEPDTSLNDTKFNHSSIKPRKIKRPTRNSIVDSKTTGSFLLDGANAGPGIPEYNPLKDRHLQYHFYNKKLRKLLRKNGLITRKDQIIEKRTCLNGDELSKRSPSPESEAQTIKPLTKGTLLLGFQLPPIKLVEMTHAQEKLRSIGFKLTSSNKRGQNSLRNPITATDMSHYATEDTRRGPLPTQPSSSGLKEQSQSKSKSKSPRREASEPKKKFMYSKTNVTSNESSHPEFLMYSRPHVNRSLDFEKARKPLPKINKKLEPFMPKIKAHSKTPLMPDLSELKPLSKNELMAVFDKFKTRLADENIVPELPEKEDGRESPESQTGGKRKRRLLKKLPEPRSRSVIQRVQEEENAEKKVNRYPTPDPIQRKITDHKLSFKGGKVPWRRIGYQESNPHSTQGAHKTPANESITPKNPFEEKLKWEDAERPVRAKDGEVIDANKLSEALLKLNPRPEAKVENQKLKSQK